LPDTLAFAEARLLTIHPFADFNGRLVRLWLWEILRRLKLPPVQLAPRDKAETEIYLSALRAGDQKDFQPLASFGCDAWPPCRRHQPANKKRRLKESPVN